ncbi:MAG: hypothetical protein AAGD06_02825 [Acidobacteriota bacterium]
MLRSAKASLALVSPCVVAAVLLTAGCATVPKPISDCRSLSLDPAPLWIAGAAWSPSGDELWVVDPEERNLIVYGMDGQFRRRHGGSEVAAFDFHNPLRLETRRRGVVLGDRTRLVELGPADGSSRPVFSGVPGAEGVFLSDWTRDDDAVVAYADIQVDEETWHRGFARFEDDRWRILQELPLEVGGEYERYYRYDARPYVVRAGGDVYVLRYLDPPVLFRAGRSGLEAVWTVDGLPGEVTRLASDGERLFVLSQKVVETEDGEGLELPKFLGGQLDAATLARAQHLAEQTIDHYVTLVDPRRGAVWTRRLPTDERAVSVVPGARAWALITSSGLPDTGKESGAETRVSLLPGDWWRRAALPASCRKE